MTRLDHVRLLVADVGASIRFYRDALGFVPTWGEEDIGYVSFSSGDGPEISLFRRESQPEASLSERDGDRVVLVLEVDDVDQEAERLRGRGVEVGGPRDEPGWGLRVAYVRDPDGNLIELMRRLPRGEWSKSLRDADRRYSRARRSS